MKNRSFLAYERPLLTCMVQANNPSRIKELIDLSLSEGAEAFGMQFCRLNPEYRIPKVYRELFSFSSLPTYVTNYRYAHNEGKSDDELSDELLLLADCGATLCDVMGDLFDRQDDEVAREGEAIKSK